MEEPEFEPAAEVVEEHTEPPLEPPGLPEEEAGQTVLAVERRSDSLPEKFR